MISKLPFPVNFAEFLLNSYSRPVRVVGLIGFGSLFLLFLATGAALPDAANTSFEDPIEILGYFLLFSLLPPYLLMCMLAGIRQNNVTHEKFSKVIGSAAQLDRYQHIRWWPLPVLFGLAFALLQNVDWQSKVFDPTADDFTTSIMLIFGQLVLWIAVFLVLFMNAHECWMLGKLGKIVPIDLYRLDELNGFGQAGLNNFLMVVGALAITTVQSIDQEFRAFNYINGLLVGIPAAFMLVTLPIWSLHQRLQQAKARALIELDQVIANTDKALDAAHLDRLNALLSRVDYVKGLRNWPMDLSTFSKLLLYVFIPPLAWVGAALVEFMLDSFLAG